MEQSQLLSRITISTPCSADWEQMEGDDQTRFCGQCQKHVYNFEALDSQEIVETIRQQEGEVCARLYRRRDGTLVTASCGSKRKRNFLQFSLASLMMLVTGTATAFGLGRCVPTEWITDHLWGQAAANRQAQCFYTAGAIEIAPEDLDDLMLVPLDESFLDDEPAS